MLVTRWNHLWGRILLLNVFRGGREYYSRNFLQCRFSWYCLNVWTAPTGCSVHLHLILARGSPALGWSAASVFTVF